MSEPIFGTHIREAIDNIKKAWKETHRPMTTDYQERIAKAAAKIKERQNKWEEYMLLAAKFERALQKTANVTDEQHGYLAVEAGLEAGIEELEKP